MEGRSFESLYILRVGVLSNRTNVMFVIIFIVFLILDIDVFAQKNITTKKEKSKFGTMKGQVLDKATQQPLIGTNIVIVGTNRGGSTDLNGKYIIPHLTPGEYVIEFSYIGYKTERIERFQISADSDAQLNVELESQTLELGEIIVTPGQFSIMGKEPTIRQTLTHDDIQAVTFGEDIYRAITRLPGISSSDFSAKFTVRGGEHEEILVLMDGLELYDPFHLKDIEGGALSIVDVEAIEGIDLLTGGFPAEYGNRMSGVFNMKSTRAASGRRRTSLGISLMNARFLSEGTFFDNKGFWLVSARRGYLDIVLDLMKEKEPLSPKYYDVLGKIEYRLNDKHTLSFNVLHADDKLDYVEDDEDEDNTSYGNSYGWLTLNSVLNPSLFVHSLVSYGKLSHRRHGIGYTGDLSKIDFTVSDVKDVDITGIKQDWTLELSERWIVKWGYDYKHYTADYDYLNTQRNVLWISEDDYQTWIDTTRAKLDPSGERVGGYLSNRFRIFRPLTAEIGLRYDYTSYTHDRLFSPRFNIVTMLGKQTFLRGGWGHFYQSQGIHEIELAEGEDAFYSAELAEHWVAGVEHTFRNGFNFRLEGYYKKMSDLRPDYRRWSNEIEIFPEVYDRFKLNFLGATSKGIETYFKYDRGGKFTWWISYALAYADEDVRSLVYEGVEYTEKSGEYPGRYDQRHTIYLDFNYRPNRNWHLNVS